jgi:hypothetical protein
MKKSFGVHHPSWSSRMRAWWWLVVLLLVLQEQPW